MLSATLAHRFRSWARAAAHAVAISSATVAVNAGMGSSSLMGACTAVDSSRMQ